MAGDQLRRDRPNPAYRFEINNLFLSTIGDNNLEQLVHKPTRNKNILDLIFSSYPAQVSDPSVILGISDHDTVLFSFNVKGIITNNPRHYIYLYQKADLGGISNHMKPFLTPLYLQTHAKTQLNKIGYSSRELFMKH